MLENSFAHATAFSFIQPVCPFCMKNTSDFVKLFQVGLFGPALSKGENHVLVRRIHLILTCFLTVFSQMSCTSRGQRLRFFLRQLEVSASDPFICIAHNASWRIGQCRIDEIASCPCSKNRPCAPRRTFHRGLVLPTLWIGLVVACIVQSAHE